MKALRREGAEKFAHLDLIVHRNRKVQHRVISPKDTGQCEAGKPAGQIEAVPRPQFRRQLLALLQRYGNGAIGLIGDEQMVFGEESGKEQAMPMLIGRQLREMADTLKPGA